MENRKGEMRKDDGNGEKRKMIKGEGDDDSSKDLLRGEKKSRSLGNR